MSRIPLRREWKRALDIRRPRLQIVDEKAFSHSDTLPVCKTHPSTEHRFATSFTDLTARGMLSYVSPCDSAAYYELTNNLCIPRVMNIETVLRLTKFPRTMLHRKRVLSLYRVGRA